MLLVHEAESRALTNRGKAAVDNKVDCADDYEVALIWLLSRLEHKRQAIVATRADVRVDVMLDLALECVDLVVGFAKENCSFAVGRDMDEAARQIRDFEASQVALRVRLQNNSNGNPPTDDAFQSLAKRCFSALHEGTAAYFTVFTGRFATSRAALPWVEAAASYIVDLKKLAREPLPIR